MTFEELDGTELIADHIAQGIAQLLQSGAVGTALSILQEDTKPATIKVEIARDISEMREAIERQWVADSSALIEIHEECSRMGITMISVYELLNEYMSQLDKIRAEIEPLQSASSSLSQEKAMMDSDAIELRQLLDVLIIDPSLVHAICDSPCDSERFLTSFKKISTQLDVQNAVLNKSSVAMVESGSELLRLRMKGIARLQSFFVLKFNALAQPGVDFISLQTASLLPLKRAVLPLIQECAPGLYEELIVMYTDLVSRLLVYQFQTYSGCLDPFVVKSSTSAKSIPSESRLKLIGNIFQRQDVIVPLNGLSQPVLIEEVCFSILKQTTDTAIEEEYFVRDFFQPLNEKWFSHVVSASFTWTAYRLGAWMDSWPDDPVGFILAIFVVDFFVTENRNSLLTAYYQTVLAKARTRLVGAMTKLSQVPWNISLVETRRISDLVACVYWVSGNFSNPGIATPLKRDSVRWIEGFVQGLIDKLGASDPAGLLSHIEAVVGTATKREISFPSVTKTLDMKIAQYSQELFRKSGFPARFNGDARNVLWVRSNWKTEVGAVEKTIIQTFPSLSLVRDVYKKFLELVAEGCAGSVAPATVMAELRTMDSLLK